MQTTGLFTCPPENFEVKMAVGEPLYFVPFGDVHADSALHTEAQFDEFLDWCRVTPNACFLGMGDYLDFLSARGRMAWIRMAAAMKTEMHGENASEAIAAEELRASTALNRFADKLIAAGMRGRIMGLLDGNHDFVFDNGDNITQRLCTRLGCRYLGVATFAGLTLECSGCRRVIDIWAHHGKGAARLPGGSVNRVVQMAEQAEADIYCMGHDHKRGAVPGARLRRMHTRTGYKLSHRAMYYLRTGSFTKAYEDGVANYAVDANMGPNPLGVVKVILTMRRPRVQADHPYPSGSTDRPGPVTLDMAVDGPEMNDEELRLDMEALS